MASTQSGLTERQATIADIDDERVLELAERHLTEIRGRQRAVPAELRPTRVPRLRWLWRRICEAGSKLLDVLEIVVLFLINPRHIPGRWFARVRLLHPTKTFSAVTLLTLVFAAALGFLIAADLKSLPPFLRSQPDWRKNAAAAVLGSLFTGTVLGFLVLLWDDLVRCPYRARRIRRQIRKRPNCVLLDDIGPHAVSLVANEEPIKIVPRSELLAELTPAVLERKRKDVQIVVGDPGAGKTTALIGVAAALAKLGIVPVMVRLHSAADFDLAKLGKQRFKQQINEYVRSDAEAETLWRWLYLRRRVALMADDLDRLSPDGERGFVLRKAITEAETVDLPIVVTARPAGVPAGIAASAIELGGLDEKEAIDCVADGARQDASFRPRQQVSRQSLARWVRAGRLTEVPYYLELLAQLAAAGSDTFPELPEPWTRAIAVDTKGLFETKPDGTASWNRWWVHFQLIDNYYDQVCAGHVLRWTGIETRERTRAMEELQDPALGLLLAGALTARAKLLPREEQSNQLPERTKMEDFIRTDDRDKRRRRREGEKPAGQPPGGNSHVNQGDAGEQERPGISASEVIETGLRLRILDRDAGDEPQFRHRITQAYLAGRRLAEHQFQQAGAAAGVQDDWMELLLDHRQPEKLTAQTALSFAALWASRKHRQAKLHLDHQRADHPQHTDEDGKDVERWRQVEQGILRGLWNSARDSLNGSAARSEGSDGTSAAPATTLTLATEEPGRSSTFAIVALGTSGAEDRRSEDRRSDGPGDLDPRHVRDPEARRDPDDALIKLTTAAVIAHATTQEEGKPRRDYTEQEQLPPSCAEDHQVSQCDVLELIRHSPLVTRWTKLNAIEAIAALDAPDRWKCIWQYARDGDYAVRQAASRVLEQNALSAYKALDQDIRRLIVRAAALSALDQELETPLSENESNGRRHTRRAYYIGVWTWDDVLGLRALGTVLPAIVSGLQEDPSLARALASWQGRDGDASDGADPYESGGHGDDVLRHERRSEERRRCARQARTALGQLVTIAFQGGYHELERAIARGFRGDAMRHVSGDADGDSPAEHSHAGPGWVAAHAHLVVTIGICQAEDWYAQLVLRQALALYAVAGGSREAAYDVFAHCFRRAGAHSHPFTRQALRLARTAVRRNSVHSDRWKAFIWEDEVAAYHTRPVTLTSRTAQLLADVTILLDLAEGAPEDRQQACAHADELPYCLHASRDRREILSTGCPPECGWNLCPYKQPPPDEPNEHRGVSRAFCRRQRWIARHHKVPWQRRISHRRLAAFWQEMERRART